MWVKVRWWIEDIHRIHDQATSPFLVKGVQVDF